MITDRIDHFKVNARILPEVQSTGARARPSIKCKRLTSDLGACERKQYLFRSKIYLAKTLFFKFVLYLNHFIAGRIGICDALTRRGRS